MGKEPTVTRAPRDEADNWLLMMGTIGDTTWRMFVPSVGLTLLGVWLDKQWSTKPWLMFVGILLGCVGAILLVWAQLRGLKRRKGTNI